MISRAIALASAMSEPTSSPSHTSAHSAERRPARVDRDTAGRPCAPPCRRWWKKIGCVSRALLPQSTIRSVSSASRYELVPPPAPNTVARPATEGACQVRLQLSMLLLPRTTRANFWAAKLTSLVALRAAEDPERPGPCAAPAARSPAASGPALRPRWRDAGHRSGGRRRARAAWSGGRTPSAQATSFAEGPTSRV